MFKKIFLVITAGILLTGCLGQKTAKQENKVEEFTGNLKEAMAKNLPMKCEWQQNQNTGASYVKGKNLYVETTVEGKKGFMISKDNCTWTWGDQMPQGVKFCAEPTTDETEQDIQEPETGSFKTEGVDFKSEYKCSPALFGDEKFELPSGVVFQDIAEMMKGFQQTIPSMPAVPVIPEIEE